MSDWVVKAVSRLPPFLGERLFSSYQFLMRQLFCRWGVHERFVGGNYCKHGCGTLLVQSAWRAWSVVLVDGSSKVVRAINEHHARMLVIYGESSSGQVNMDAVTLGRFAVDERNIVSCTPGEIASNSP